MSNIAFKLTTLALATTPLLADLTSARAENGQVAAGIYFVRFVREGGAQVARVCVIE